MDISEIWKKLEQDRLQTPIEGNLKNPKHSCHPIAKLKRNYFMKTIMMAVFMSCFVVLFFLFDQILIRWTLGALVVAYTIFFTAGYFIYKGISSEPMMDGTVLEVLTTTKEQIERALRFETISSVVVYPTAGAAGYLMGYTVSGADANKILGNSNQIMIFTGIIIVFTVIGYFLGRTLTREGYGKAMDEIGVMIEELRRGQ